MKLVVTFLFSIAYKHLALLDKQCSRAKENLHSHLCQVSLVMVQPVVEANQQH